jgi:hypothetical protein
MGESYYSLSGVQWQELLDIIGINRQVAKNAKNSHKSPRNTPGVPISRLGAPGVRGGESS